MGMNNNLPLRWLTVVMAFLVVAVGTLNAQNITIKGVITDSKTNTPIPFASVSVPGTTQGTTTDINGVYKLALPEGEWRVQYKMLGYKPEFKVFKLKLEDSLSIEVNIKLIAEGTDLGPVIVSGSKYEQRLEDLIVSVEIIRPNIIENKNATSIDKAIESAPGITVVDNEPQVRGGSGFSSGLGSRVQLIIDDIPLLRGDAGRPVWPLVPVENVDQIEVLKGASSVLYGSSALNGAINIRTAYAKDKPETKMFAFTGMYSKPQRRYATYWDGLNPMVSGMSFVHTRRVKNVDFVFGGNFFRDDGYIGPEPVSPLNGNKINKGEYDRRGRLNLSVRVKNKKVEGLFYGVNANGMVSRNAQAFFWANADSGIYKAFPGSITNFNEVLWYVDPYVQYFTPGGHRHVFRNRIFYSNNEADNNQNTSSIQMYNEYQHVNKVKKVDDFYITAGVTSIYTNSQGQVFSGNEANNGNSYSYNLAAYAQFDKKFFGRLNVTAGGRFEYFEINKKRQTKPVFRAGVNYGLTEATFIRASFGQGFRFPSIGERYIRTQSGGFGFFPNNDLVAESSWNAETGVKQLFKIKDFVGYADLTGFYQEYDNFIEFNAGIWGTDPDFAKNIGFKFLNTGRARVTGVDFSITGMGEIAKDLSITLLAGYTYSRPITLQPDLVYATSNSQTNNQYTYRSSSTDQSGVLKYRIEHLGKVDVELNYKPLMVGFSTRYYSQMRNIDVFFYQLDQPGFLNTGITNYRANHTAGMFVFDVRAGVKIYKALGATLIVSNLLNKEYSLRPLNLEPPRLTTLQLSYKL